MLASGKGLSVVLVLPFLPSSLLFLVPGGLVGGLRPLGRWERPYKLVEKAGFWSRAVEVKASPELLWLCGARRELCRAVAEPQGLATHLHVSFCLLEDTDCPCTPWVEPRLCWPPLRAVLPSLEPVCVCPPNRPQPRPLWLQELALPCNVLILIKVQTGFFWRWWGAQVWDEKGTALPHPYCMPPRSFFFSHLQLKTMHFTDITHTYLTGAGHPASALGKDSQRTTLSPRCPS